LSSAAPRATMTLRPSGKVAIRGSKGWRVPQIKRIDRLDVVMAVEQGPPAVAVAFRQYDGWPAVGRTSAAKPTVLRSAARCSAAVRHASW